MSDWEQVASVERRVASRNTKWQVTGGKWQGKNRVPGVKYRVETQYGRPLNRENKIIVRFARVLRHQGSKAFRDKPDCRIMDCKYI